MIHITTVFSKYVRSYNTRLLQISGLLSCLSHGRPGWNYSVFSLLSTHSSSITMPLYSLGYKYAEASSRKFLTHSLLTHYSNLHYTFYKTKRGFILNHKSLWWPLYSHFYMSITLATLAIFDSFDVDYLVCRRIAVGQHIGGLVYMRGRITCSLMRRNIEFDFFDWSWIKFFLFVYFYF